MPPRPPKPKPPEGYYVLNGIPMPWRWYPMFMYVGYRIEGGEAVSLCGTKRCKLPNIERNGNIDVGIATFLCGAALGFMLFCIVFT